MVKKRNDKRIPFPIEAEHSLSFLFGQYKTHGLADSITEKHWSELCERLISHLEKYVHANVITDRNHRDEMDRGISKMRTAVQSNLRDPMLVIALSKFCLILLGRRPNQWNRKAINKQKHFALDQFRNVHYSQSPKQQADLILTHCILPKVGGAQDKEFRDLRDVYFDNYAQKGKYADFAEWFRKEYPTEYLKLFV